MELATIAANEVGVDLFFFTLQDVQVGKSYVNGWQRSQDGTWTQNRVPWPDVFQPATRIRFGRWNRVKDILFSCSTPVNSRDVLDKWDTHRALNFYPEMIPYLPRTILYRSPRDIQKMLLQHQSVLAKPCKGLGAQNISKIWREPHGRYGWEDSSTGSRLTNLSFRNVVSQVRKNSGGPFVLQEELAINEFEGKRNKIRVILNKDGTGMWRQSLSYAFIGKPGQFAVSRHQGAEQMPLGQGLLHMGLCRTEVKDVISKLSELSLLTVKCLDKVLGPMGEIGLDLALGETGAIWLIEANARPNKDNLPFTNKRVLLRPFILMMQYALYLARQHHKRRCRVC